MENSELEEATIQPQNTWTGTLCAYFRDFLETDFKKSAAPKRNISNMDKSGLRMGFDIYQYPTLRESVADILNNKIDLDSDIQLEVGRSQHRSTLKKGLLKLVKAHIDSIDIADIEESKYVIRHLFESKLQGDKVDPDTAAIEIIAGIRNRLLLIIINPLLTNLNSQMKMETSDGLDMVQTLEDEIGEIITNSITEKLDDAVAQILVEKEFEIADEIIEEVTNLSEVYSQLIEYFETFQTNDAFEDLNGLTATIKIKENHQLYLYIGNLTVKNTSFPLLFIPCEASINNSKLHIKIDPHLFINKKAVDYACGELTRELGRPMAHHIDDRIIYLEQGQRINKVAQGFLDSFAHSIAFGEPVDLSNPIKTVATRGSVKLDNRMYFAAFDQSDESLLNDYESLIQLCGLGEGLAFEKLIASFMSENPVSFDAELDSEWAEKAFDERLVYDRPVPVNEEQQKIISSLSKSDCKFVSVEGPPGTGKSHTITAIVFNAILKGKNVLVLSDKKEALDVVEGKITSIIKKVRFEDNVQDPILRLGKHGNSFTKILSNKTIENLKRGQGAASAQEKPLDDDIFHRENSLKSMLRNYSDSQKSINLQDVAQFEENSVELGLSEDVTLTLCNNEAAKQIISAIDFLCDQIDENNLTGLFEKFSIDIEANKIQQFMSYCRIANNFSETTEPPIGIDNFRVFKSENSDAFETLIADYINSRMPIFGFLFKRSRLLLLNARLAEITGHKNASNGQKHIEENILIHSYLKSFIAEIPNEKKEDNLFVNLTIQSLLDGFSLDQQVIEDITESISLLNSSLEEDLKLVAEGLGVEYEGAHEFLNKSLSEAAISIKIRNLETHMDNFDEIADAFRKVPKIDFSDQMRELELLKTKKLTNAIDKSVIEFASEKRNSAEKIKDIIKKKQKFPSELFEDLKKAFPIIIAGIRDYAEYVPLETDLFDVVIIDEASQVSIAQALPAFIRAKKVIVFGDKKQFSNVKTANASKNTNQAYKNVLRSKFVEQAGHSSADINQLGLFDIKTSVLDFCDRLANMKIMLRKHFRGYPELISLSSKYFYQNGLQAVKVRGKPISDVISFDLIQHDGLLELQGTVNEPEAEKIVQDLEAMLDEDGASDVMVITPHTDQQKLITRKIYQHVSSSEIYEKLNLRVFTFDTCQGEEADLVIYSMVASEAVDRLRHIFPQSLNESTEVEENLRLQRLNVGFSRAKEKIRITHSKPLSEFTGSIGQSLNHYLSYLSRASAAPDPSETDPNSPMEKKVLGWLIATPIAEELGSNFEIDAQFEIGNYLRQLDPTYEHPSYKVDFLLKVKYPSFTLQIVIEYDGFREHFVNRSEVNASNYMSYMREEDVSRQMTLESYNYKFIRINRFNSGKDPVAELDARIRKLITMEEKDIVMPQILERMHSDEEKIKSKVAKLCSRCGLLKETEDFKDLDLKTGEGRVCKDCKNQSGTEGISRIPRRSTRKSKGQESLYFGDKIYLSCPYSEKDECKKLGGRWDRFAKKWYIHDDQDRSLFKKWL